jgi:hypothetical protein
MREGNEMPAFTRDYDPPMPPPVVISQNQTHMIAIEIPRAMLVRHKRFIEILLASATEPKPEEDGR